MSASNQFQFNNVQLVQADTIMSRLQQIVSIQ